MNGSNCFPHLPFVMRQRNTTLDNQISNVNSIPYKEHDLFPVTVSTGIFTWSLKKNVVEVCNSWLQVEGLLSLLDDIQALAPSVAGVQLSQILGNEHMWLDPRRVNADNASALGMNTERVAAELL